MSFHTVLLLFCFSLSSIAEECKRDNEVLDVLRAKSSLLHQPEGEDDNSLMVYLGTDEINSLRVVPHSNHIRIDLQLMKRWKDSRVQFTDLNPCRSYINIGKDGPSFLWFPVTLGTNGDDVTYHTKSMVTTLSQNGTVTSITRVQLNVPCKTEALNYPFGNTICTLVFKNEAASRDSYLVVWDQNTKERVMDQEEHKDIGDMKLVDVVLGQSEVFGANAVYDELTLSFHLKRGHKKVLLLFFLPSLLFMVVSWLSLSLGPMAITRSLLSSCSLLLLLIHYSTNSAGLPETTGITAIDVWKIFSFLFVIAILIELVIVTCMASMGRSSRLSSCCQKKRTKGKYSLEPLYEELNDLRARRTRSTCGCCRYSALFLDFFSLWVFAALLLSFVVFFYLKSSVAVKWLNDINLDEINIV